MKKNRYSLRRDLLRISACAFSYAFAFAFALALPMALLSVSIKTASAQTTADELYFAVQHAQASLGMSTEADTVRDQFSIRELETESAKGFSADQNILQSTLGRLQTGNNLSDELNAVRSALENHLAALSKANSIDLENEISNLSTDLKVVDLGMLESARDETIEVINSLDKFHEGELSYYGRHYINKKLKLKKLRSSLEDFEFRVEDVDIEAQLPDLDESEEDHQKRVEKLESDKQNEFNRNINRLRNELAVARKVFGAATFSYNNLPLAFAERQIADMEDRIGAYLLFQSRRKELFEENLKVRKQAFVSQDGVNAEPDDRLYQAELGRWINFLRERNELEGIDAAVRRQYSRPNFKVTVQESLVNRLGSRPVSQMDHLDEVIVGSRALGWNYTSGLVSLDFVRSPHSALVRINLSGSIQSSAYTKEGPVTAYTSSAGNFNASRDLKANVGNLSIYAPYASASVTSTFLGTNCLPVVTQIAQQRFSERQFRAEEVASERAKDRVMEQFSTESDVALLAGVEQLDNARSRQGEILELANSVRQNISELLAQDENGVLKEPYDLIDPFVLPRIFVTTTDSALEIGGVLEANNRLAAPIDAPAPTVPCDFRVQLHESMLSNLIAPFIQNRLISNEQMRNTVESLASGNVNLPDQEDDRPFSIRFEDGRPVQVEFDDQEIAITIFGKQFRQGRNSYDDPLSISVRTRIIQYEGKLKLSRTSKAVAEFTYDPLKDKTWDVTFKSFLQDNLDAAIGGIETPEEAFPLPDDLLFVKELIEDEEMRNQLSKMKLVECIAENGWLTLGWNYQEGATSGYATNTPAIWTDLSIYESKTDDGEPGSDGDSKPADSDAPSLDMDGGGTE